MIEPVNQRGKYKAMLFKYDDFLPDESEECLYCLTDNQAMLLRGLLEPMAWKTRWWSNEEEIDLDVITSFRDDMIRRLMMTCCGEEELHILFRYTSGGVLQKSTDGGETWEDAPEDDVRNNSPQFPPPSGEDVVDNKCIAATGGAALLKEQVGENLTDDMTRAALLAILTGWVSTFIQTSSPFEALKTVVNNIVFALQIVLLRPALTDDTYDQFKCILYCHMSDDASFTQDQWNAVLEQVFTDITGIAGTFFTQIVYLLGAGGLTNLVRAAGANEGDCSDCCPDCAALFEFGAGTIIDTSPGVLTVQGVFSVPNNRYEVIAQTGAADECCTITAIAVVGSFGTPWGCIVCPNAQVTENIVFPLGNSAPENFFFMTDTSPFTVEIHFS